MSLEKQIITLLNNTFFLENLKVINESHLHQGHLGDNGTGETHFKITFNLPKEFENLSKVQQHKKIYAALSSCFKEGLHALSIEINKT